jgi:16S rRNA (adenine1518-N6/adenine1519-N6)-dimethyltransferase
LRDVIDGSGLRALKSLGQNFLTDPRITDRIAAQAGNLAGRHIIEIGPGPGGLTRSLCATDARAITAIEFDTRAITALEPLRDLMQGRLEIIEADALKLPWADFLRARAPATIVANLPYNIATPLLIDWLRVVREAPGTINTMVLMFQREVADRITATPATSDYGRLSVLAQWLCQTENCFTLPPGAFTPPPKVYSSVIRLTPRPSPVGADQATPSFATMEKIVARAFMHRRKMLRGHVKEWVEPMVALGLDPTMRAENLSVADYVALSAKISL